MRHTVRKYARKVINKATRPQNELIETSTGNIIQTLLAINHGLLSVTQETNERLKNSSTITISDREILTKIFSGLKMYLDPRDLSITPHLALDSIWEHDITAAWLKVLGPEDVVMEIGANNGYYGALAGQQSGPNAHIVFIEANPNHLPYIRKTLAANWLMEKSRVEHLALSDSNGKATFNVSPYYQGAASMSHDLDEKSYALYKIQEEKLEKVTVKTQTLDDYCKQNKINAVDLIIMDIEGFEETAYKGMRGIVKKSPRMTMFIEFTKQGYKNPEKFFEQMLADFGHVYLINKDGSISKPKRKTYASVIGTGDEWKMPIFSKRSDLDKL